MDHPSREALPLEEFAAGDRLLRWILALGDAPIRVAALRAMLRERAPETLAADLDALCARAEQADDRAREALLSLVDALAGTDAPLRRRVQQLREEAVGEMHLALERLLRQPQVAPARGLEPAHGKEGRNPDHGLGRPLTLGERKSLARRSDRALLARLLLDPHPDVIQRLLCNPGITEDDVVRLAAKRPCRGEVLAELARSERWIHRARVRIALVLNPSTPFEVAAPIVLLLIRQELRLVSTSTHVSPALRALCLERLERRPPVDVKRPTSLH